MHRNPTEPDELTVHCRESPDVTVRLYDRYSPDEYGTGFSVDHGHVGDSGGVRSADVPVITALDAYR
ncbi:hypothetical protein AB0H43_38795 [Hamadaea sp. NPDC050747]|uniref:hypothetical protein n=1 Tax=Hamadaea sp. NPDC050747 TaxID=3155789 RepID=UPI0033FBA0C3